MALNSLPLGKIEDPITESWAYTQIKNEKFSFTWTIENFSLHHRETGQFLASPEFSVNAKDTSKYKWFLRICPKGNIIENKEFLSVFLYLRSCNKSSAKCKYKFSILDAKKEQTNSKSVNEIRQFEIMIGNGFRKFIQRDLLFKDSHLYLPKDTLTILCEGSIPTDTVNESGQGHRSKITVPDGRLVENFKNLSVNEDFSDVILEVSGHEIKAHKAILASKSNVFAAMFKHNLEENKTNRIAITDIDHEVLKEMLRFIYTGNVSCLEKIAKHLYAAADKYALEKLKVMCEKVLLVNLSTETAAETLILAYLHSSVQMKAEAMDFIKSHITDIMKTKGWLGMMTSYSELATEIIQSLVKQ